MSDFKYHLPRRRSIDLSGNTKSVCVLNSIALMCPHCLYIIEVDVISNSIFVLNDKVEDFHIENNYYGLCPNCKEDAKFEAIDANMAQIIYILNSKGYYTAFCCEGHIEPDEYNGEDSFSYPYIYFYLWKDAEILNHYPLPDTWCIEDVDKKAEIFSIKDNIIEEMPKSIINGNEIIDEVAYIGWLKRHWGQEKRLEDIYNWAISLPDKSDDEKRADYEYLKENSSDILIDNANRYIKILNEE